MQKNPAKTEFTKLHIKIRISITFISRYGMTHVGSVRADLMGPARRDRDLHQGGSRTITLDDAELT